MQNSARYENEIFLSSSVLCYRCAHRCIPKGQTWVVWSYSYAQSGEVGPYVVLDRLVLEGAGLYKTGSVSNLRHAGVNLNFVFKKLVSIERLSAHVVLQISDFTRVKCKKFINVLFGIWYSSLPSVFI